LLCWQVPPLAENAAELVPPDASAPPIEKKPPSAAVMLALAAAFSVKLSTVDDENPVLGRLNVP
jgi:hypothetical protein